MIGMNIRVLRKKHKISQEQLAERIHVSRQTIAKWENDEALPDIHKSKLLADIFQVTLDQLSERKKEDSEVNIGTKIEIVLSLIEKNQENHNKAIMDTIRYGFWFK